MLVCLQRGMFQDELKHASVVVCMFVCGVLSLQVLGHLVMAVTSGVIDSTGRPGVMTLHTHMTDTPYAIRMTE